MLVDAGASFAAFHLREGPGGRGGQCNVSLPGLPSGVRYSVVQLNWWEMTTTTLVAQAEGATSVGVGYYGTRSPRVLELRRLGA